MDGLDIKIDIESDIHKHFSKSLERTEWILYIPVFIFTKLLIPVFSVVHKIMVLFFQGPGVGPTLVCKMVILKMMIYVLYHSHERNGKIVWKVVWIKYYFRLNLSFGRY